MRMARHHYGGRCDSYGNRFAACSSGMSVNYKQIEIKERPRRNCSALPTMVVQTRNIRRGCFYLFGGITMKNTKTAAYNSNIPPGVSGCNRLDKTSTYKVNGKTFIVEPVFQKDGHDTLGTILMRLMRADADRF